MATPNNPTANIDNIRLKEARERYQQASLASERNRKEMLETGDRTNNLEPALLKFLQSQANQNKRFPNEQKLGSNIASLPVPLPVKPIDPEALTTQVRTNQMLKQLSDTIVRTSLPQPVRIDDSKIASESTLSVVSYLLDEINRSIHKLVDDMLSNIKNLNGSIRQGFFKSIESEEKERGWATKFISKSIDKIRGISPKTDTFMERLIRYTKPIADFAKKQSEQLQMLIQLQLAQLTTKTDEARQKLISKGLISDTSDGPKGAFTGLVDSILPEKSVIRSAIGVVTTVGALFSFIGKWGASQLARVGITNMALRPLLKNVPGALKVLRLFGGIAGFISGIVGSAVFSSVYAAFKNPDQLAGYLGVFGRLFTENIIPTLKWISTEIVPILSMAFAGLMVVTEQVADKLGTFINNFLIGALYGVSETFTMVGKVIDSLWQGMKKVVTHALGIFGIGPNGDVGVVNNILGVFDSFAKVIVQVGDAILEWISQGFTSFLSSMGLTDWMGLNEGESMYGRIKRFLSQDIPELIGNVLTGLTAKIGEWIEEFDPGGMMRDKFMSLINAIGSIFPSWQDIKNFVTSAIESSPLPQRLRRWMINAINGESQAPIVIDSSRTSEFRNKSIQERARIANSPNPTLEGIKSFATRAGEKLTDIGTGLVGSTYIFAPQSATTNNSTSVRGGGSSNSSSRIPGAQYIPQTPPIDQWLHRANPW